MIMQYVLEEELNKGSYKIMPKTIFLFPLDLNAHRNPDATLFSMPSGKNPAAILDATLSKERKPTLGLAMNKNIKEHEQSIADIYRAIGADYKLVLPVRKFNIGPNRQFSSSIYNGELPKGIDIEPCFPNNIGDRNKRYLIGIENINMFLAMSADERNKFAVSNIQSKSVFTPYMQAYLNGVAIRKKIAIHANSIVNINQIDNSNTEIKSQHSQEKKQENLELDNDPEMEEHEDMAAIHADDQSTRSIDLEIASANNENDKDESWAKEPEAHAVARKSKEQPKTAQSEKPSTLNNPKCEKFPASYHALYARYKNNSPMLAARMLLNDYTKGGDSFCNAVLRFFHGHVRRHYVSKVAAIVRKIDNNELSEPG